MNVIRKRKAAEDTFNVALKREKQQIPVNEGNYHYPTQ